MFFFYLSSALVVKKVANPPQIVFLALAQVSSLLLRRELKSVENLGLFQLFTGNFQNADKTIIKVSLSNLHIINDKYLTPLIEGSFMKKCLHTEIFKVTFE